MRIQAFTLAVLLAVSPSVTFAQSIGVGTEGKVGAGSGSGKFPNGTRVQGGQGITTSTGTLIRFQEMPGLSKLEPQGAQLDPAIDAALTEAESLMSSDPAKSREIAMMLAASEDPFTVAQRPLFGDRLAKLLRELARAADQRDALVLSDAAWTVSMRAPDANHAQRLTQASVIAKRDGNSAEALWLVRRALVAAPDYGDAIDLEHRLSNNPNRGLGWGLFWGGWGSLVASAVLLGLRGSAHKELTTVVHTRDEADDLLARRNTLGTMSLAAAGLGVAALFGSLGVLSAGARSYRPESPSDLPATGDWK